MHRFWQVPEEVTSQLAPGLEDPKLRQQFVHNMYYKVRLCMHEWRTLGKISSCERAFESMCGDVKHAGTWYAPMIPPQGLDVYRLLTVLVFAAASPNQCMLVVFAHGPPTIVYQCVHLLLTTSPFGTWKRLQGVWHYVLESGFRP